jgi:metal-responsive CopG/Arc/MetJ family transcriptional regulator
MKKVKWCIQVSDKLDKETEEATEVAGYISKSDFVRDAVRSKIKEATR